MMGFYVNPIGMTKELFLELNGRKMTPHEVADYNFSDRSHLPVCLVTNPGFTAAGIAYDAKERDAFFAPDGRFKVWYLVPVKHLQPFLPGDLLNG
jgi:hypothetical protein